MLLPRGFFEQGRRAIPHSDPAPSWPLHTAVSDRASSSNRGIRHELVARGSKMNQLTIVPTFPALRSTVLDRLFDYLDDHGESLDNVFRQVRADPDVGEQAALREIAEQVQATKDGRTLTLRLQTIMDELLCVIGEPLAEIEGAYYGPEFDRALSWHAARLTDLGRDIKFAFRV
ncbi:hypothetical protein [Roseovarius sp. MBR-6]|jgi:hypothetical protein|uniref:hypothetical protein n=1 Tax=Roseovarius sp. MBR-6 TaxID=3156459 RepID=UPI003399401F